MKKFIILAVVFLGLASTSFALEVTGFAKSQNHSAIGVGKSTNLNINKTYKPTFAATDVIAAVATGTRAVTTDASSTNTTTDNLYWNFYQCSPAISIASFEIFVNGVSVVYGESDNDPESLWGTIPISVGDVVSVTLTYVSGNALDYREIWFEHDGEVMCDYVTNGWSDPSYLTYTHQKYMSGSNDVYLNMSVYTSL